MAEVKVALRNVAGTEAALGWAGAHTIVVDRPEGKAGGSGLGFNGAELLGLALGGCFANDLRYVAHELGIALDTVEIGVTVTLDGTPLVATDAAMTVACTCADGGDPAAVIAAAEARCTVSHSLQRGVRVTIARAG